MTPASGANATLAPGQSLQLVAVVRDPAGSTVSAAIAWSSSAVAVATVTSSGLVTAVAPGTVVITASATSGTQVVTGSVSLTVQAPPTLTTVAISPATSSIQVGASLQLTASPLDQNGSPIAATTTWSSSAPAVATVSATGLVTAVTAGTAAITVQAAAGGTTVTATRTITVTAAPRVLSTVAISAPASTVNVGETLQLTAVARDQFGAPIEAAFAWASSNTTRATVSGSGLVTGVAGGTVSITVQASAGGITVSDLIGITVQVPLVLTSVTVTAPSTTVTVGSTLQLTATPRDQFGDPIAASVSWSSSASAVASVNATGRVTGVSAGMADITALATMGSATASAFLTITVNAPAFPAAATVGTAGLSFTPATVDIAQGGTVTWTGLLGHNVTFTSPGSPANISGTSSESRTFNTAGTFNYFCSIHGSGMSGSVVVH